MCVRRLFGACPHAGSPASTATAAGAPAGPGVVARGGRNPQDGMELMTGSARPNPVVASGVNLLRVPGVPKPTHNGVTMSKNAQFDASFTHRLSGKHTVVVGRPKQGTTLPGQGPRPFGGVKPPIFRGSIPGPNAGFAQPSPDGCA